MSKQFKVALTVATAGAVAATRWVGGTASGAPVSGTFVTGDWVVAQNGVVWICTAGGTPGTWANAGSSVSPATTVTSETTYGIASAVGTSLLYARQDHTHGSPTTPVTALTGTASQITVSASTGSVTLSLPAAITTPGTLNTTGNLSENGSRVYSSANANLSGTVVSNTTYGLAATAGVGATYSAGDHSHGTTAYPQWKDPVKAASSTGNVAIASALVNGLVLDGVTLATGDRVLLKNQTTAAENGIYVVVASGAASRSADADTAAKIFGMTVHVIGGSSSSQAAGANFCCTNASLPTLGTTALTFDAIVVGSVVVATGATSAGTVAGRFVGNTALSAPASGTWLTGDFITSNNGHVWVCTAGGTPGTWADIKPASALTAADIGTGTFPNGTYNFNGTNIQLQGGTGSIVLQGTLTAVGTVNGQTDMQFNGASLPRGRVAGAQITANVTGIGLTSTLVTGVACTFTYVTGRRYRAIVQLLLQQASASALAGTGEIDLRWAAGGSILITSTVLQAADFPFGAVNSQKATLNINFEFTCVASGATGNQVNAGSNTLGITALMPTAASLVVAGATFPGQITIEDIGT